MRTFAEGVWDALSGIKMFLLLLDLKTVNVGSTFIVDSQILSGARGA